jgi:hypothetical protein
MTAFENLGDDDWDAELATDLVGSTLLVGLTFLDASGTVTGRRQIFGTVQSCDQEEGIAIRTRAGGEIEVIAPVLDAIDVGEPGVYQLTDSDEVVENPDFTALITVTSPPLA